MTPSSGQPSQQLLHSFDELSALGLIQESRPPGVGALPVPGNPWQPVQIEQRIVFVHQSVLVAMATFPLSIFVSFAQEQGRDLKKRLRKSGRTALILMTVFLPVVLTHTWPNPTRPGSRNTMGMALVGFIAFLCIPGFVAGLATSNWIFASTCVYWWAGGFLLAREYRSRGFMV